MAQEAPVTNQYTYQSLSDREFRLLELHAGEYGSPISISLEHLPLAALSGAYEALSYVWGTSPERLKVTCDGGHLNVTSNLYQALQRLRLPAEIRVLWVDSICINQENNEERSRQVCLMGEIYQQALGVIVWLGEADNTSRLAMATLVSWE